MGPTILLLPLTVTVVFFPDGEKACPASGDELRHGGNGRAQGNGAVECRTCQRAETGEVGRWVEAKKCTGRLPNT